MKLYRGDRVNLNVCTHILIGKLSYIPIHFQIHVGMLHAEFRGNLTLSD